MIGWSISPCYCINLHGRDLELLKDVKNFFKNVGHITIGRKTAIYRVRDKKGLLVIMNHFNNYPLQTSKYINYQYFIKILELMNLKSHLKLEGFLLVVSLVNKLNNPLSESLFNKISQLGNLGPFLNFQIKN